MASELDSYTVLELRQILPMYGIKCSDISGTGKCGCILKKDIISILLQHITDDTLPITTEEVRKNNKEKKEAVKKVVKKEVVKKEVVKKEVANKEPVGQIVEKKNEERDVLQCVKDIDAIISNNVKIFDFVKYKKEFEYMKTYFTGLELYLRTALFIDYKYNHMKKENRNVLEDQIKEKPKKKRKEYIELVLDAFEPLYLLTQWFHYFIPERLIQRPEHVFNVADKYKYHIDVMFNRMYKIRVDPDWDECAKLWFS